ncbi:EDD domain protein, DegV family [Actinopolyspora mzabensis]|uniref:EDD domain protein, DegV family n=1 Tax=Actinopolyspora mzabensis TaxID=995066 RepID=A0A1G9E600_ACTMZ|nr:DegV family protein [Actinopolyspora mzabensis]SDK71523.1 EDD domain protein, DegV family [Actinopolyspora mzabensis]
MSVAVVTDSTAYLPARRVEYYGVRVIPLHVSTEAEQYSDETSFGPGRLTEELRRGRRVTTSGAAVAEFAAAYRAALDRGADGVLSIHLSGELSGTVDAARTAAREVAPSAINVVDSRSVAMGLGFAVLAAAELAAEGAGLEEVTGVAERVAERGTILFSVQTLEYLRRGGRIGTASALLGTALAIKPLLHLHDGVIDAAEKVRTTSAAVRRLEQLAVEAVAETAPTQRFPTGDPRGPALAVHHLAAPGRAETLARNIRERLPGCSDCVVSEVGATIGAHIGPGSVGVVVLPGGWSTTGTPPFGD